MVGNTRALRRFESAVPLGYPKSVRKGPRFDAGRAWSGMEETISDPTGFQVILTDECWRHIAAHHPEMEPRRDLVREAIQRSDGIHLGRRDPARRIYRKRCKEVPGLGGPLDALVFVGNEDRYVATAYLAALGFRMLGSLIWPSK